MPEIQTVLVRYREKGGDLKFEYITGTQAEIEAVLKGYLSSKDPSSLKVLESTSPLELDDIENAVVMMDLAHHMVHEGDSFTLSDFDADVDVAGPKYWLIRVPANVEFHIKISIECDTGSLLEFFENPTITGDGTELTFYNNNRNSSNTTTMFASKDPTNSAEGTRLQSSRVGAGREKKLGGVGRTQFEWILKSGEEYLIKITVDSNDAEVTMTADGYEVPTA